MTGGKYAPQQAAGTPRWSAITSGLGDLPGHLARRPLRLGGLLAGLFALALAQAAWADTGDVKIKPEKPLPTAHVVINKDKTVTVTLIGGWSWPTHGSNCNENRAGAGVAVDWFDPSDPGFELGASVTIEGKSVPIAVGGVGDNSNAADNVVHPTENDTGAGSVVDVAKASEYKSWRGGCGVFTTDKFFKSSEAAKKGETTEGVVAHGNFGKVAPGETDFEGNPFVNPTPPSSSTLQGAQLKHTYLHASEVTRICAVMYDVHPGTAPSKNAGVGIPSGEKEIIAGGSNHNSDNGVQGNSGTPTGNACPKIVIGTPKITTEAKSSVTFDKTNGNDLKDKGTLKNGLEPVNGTITFRLFEEGEVEGKKKACAKEVGNSEVAVTKNGEYESGAVHVSKAGTYHWVASFEPAAGTNNLPFEGSCGESGENTEVLPPEITVTKTAKSKAVFKGNTVTFEITVKNTGKVNLEKVKVTDEETPACNKEIGPLKIGESSSYECTSKILEAPIVNVAKGCGVSESVEVCSEGEVPVGIEELSSEQDFKPADTASITVTGTGTSPPNGKVTFKLYKGSCESANLIFTSPEVQVTEGKASAESSKLLSELLKEAGLSTATAGTYNWQISYGSDTNGNASFTGSCGTEHFTVTNS
jgi:hypothetical protein